MADDGVACPYSVEEIKSLTIPKLKAELTRLNHPIGSIKRKPQLVAALTAYVEQEKGKQQHETDEPNPDSKEDASTTPKAPDSDASKDGEHASSGAPKDKEQRSSPTPAERSGTAPQDSEETDNSTSEKGSNAAGCKQPKLSPRKKSKPIAEPHPVPAEDTGSEGNKKNERPPDGEGTTPAAATAAATPAATAAASSEVADEGQKASEGNDKDPAPSASKIGTDAAPESRSEQKDTTSKTPKESPTKDASSTGAGSMDVDSGSPGGGGPVEESAARTPRGKTPRKGRKRTSKGVVDDDRSEAKEGAQGSADPGLGGGAGGDDVDTPERKSKRSRKSSPSTKDNSGKADESSKNPVPKAETSQKGDETAASTGFRNGGMAEKAEKAGKPGETQVRLEPMEEESSEVQNHEKQQDKGGNEEEARAPPSEPSRGDDGGDVAPVAAEPEVSGTTGGDAVDAGESGKGEEAQPMDEGEGEGGDGAQKEAEPAINPVSIRVDNFVRPFTAPQAKKLVEDKAGAAVLEGGFWMDSIKTHCYATFDGEEPAKRAIEGLQGLQWPERSSKRLAAKIGDVSAEEAKARDEAKRAGRRIASSQAGVAAAAAAAAAASGSGAKSLAKGFPAEDAAGQKGTGSNGTASGGKPGAGLDDADAASATSKPSARVRGRGSVQAPGVERGEGRGGQATNGDGARRTTKQEKVEDEPFVLDKLFRKTSITPSLYWLPLSEEEVGERKKKMEAEGTGPRTTHMPADHIASVSSGARNGGGGGGGRGGWAGGFDRRDYGTGSLSYASRHGYADPYYGRAGGGRRR